MKNYSVITNYKQLVAILWILIGFILWLQLIDRGPLLIAFIANLFYLLPIILFNIYLSNHVLPKAIHEKKMHYFVMQFLFFSFIVGLITGTILYAGGVIQQKGYIESSPIFSDEPVFWIEVRDQLLSVMVINLAFCGIRFYYEHAKLEKVNLEYQLQTLRNQITPHFMFNVLNHIHILMEYDVQLASSLLIKYSDILRYQLYNGDNETVELEQDVQFMKDFIDIEKVRWGDKLRVTCEWNIENGKIRIPSLLFITFVENAFKHVSRLPSDDGYVNIRLHQTGNNICMEVKNSKTSLSQQERKTKGLGVENMKKRLDILFHHMYDLQIKESSTMYYSKLIINL